MGSVSFLFVRIFAAIIAAIASLTPLYKQNVSQLELDKAAQISHIESLEESYASQGQIPADDGNFFDGDLDAALESGIKFNELRYIATHNSYKNESVPELKMWYGIVSRLTFGYIPDDGGEFCLPALSDQLDSGIRSLEMDVEVMHEEGETSFVCIHSPVLDMTTNSYDFSLALKEIKLWSDAHPGHLPITVIVEPKVAMLPMVDMDVFTFKNALALDAVLKDELGEKLFTPSDMLRDYSDFAAMRKADDWPEVSEMLGRILVLMHPTVVTGQYILNDRSMRTQAMFPMMRVYEKSSRFAAFLVENDPGKAEERAKSLIDEEKFIIRTRPDSYGSVKTEDRTAALNSNAQILSTDYPPMDNVNDPFSFKSGSTLSLIK